MTGPLLGREPVATVSTVVALLIAVLPAFGWSTETVGAVTAALVVLGGAVEAGLVGVDRLLPLLVGVGKAVIAAVASFGVHLPDNWVAAGMAVLTVFAGLQVRKQVSAVQPPTDRDGREVDRSGFVIGELDATADAERAAEGPSTPESGAHAHTEVFGAVAADGPLPDAQGREQHSEGEAQTGQGSSARHRLDPEFGA